MQLIDTTFRVGSKPLHIDQQLLDSLMNSLQRMPAVEWMEASEIITSSIYEGADPIATLQKFAAK